MVKIRPLITTDITVKTISRSAKGSFLNYLCNESFITQDQKRVLEAEARRTPSTIEKLVVQLGFLNAHELLKVLSSYGNIDVFDKEKHIINTAIVTGFPQAEATIAKILPIALDAQTATLWVLVVDMDDIIAFDKVRRYFPGQYRIVPLLIGEVNFHTLLDQLYSHPNFYNEQPLKEVSNAVIATDKFFNPIFFVEEVLQDAIKRGASDIHFEPEANFVHIRQRCDGLLKLYRTIHRDQWPALCVRLKIISGMDIAESRLPQDGRISFHLNGRDIDLRTAVHPTLHGENIVVRILDKHHSLKNMQELGFDDQQIATLRTLVQQPEGMIILTGPTGSGKTTTLYSLLQFIRSQDLNIMTLEEPVEYEIQGIRQTEIKELVNMSYADGVRSILRQDPDVILIGEIRDAETAEMAMRAALTGHLVLTTLHAHDCFSAFHRLANLGVTPSLMVGNILGIISQRLLRQVCRDCQQNILNHPLHHTCPACEGSGYKGRIATAEILIMNEELETLIETQQPLMHLRACAQRYGFQSLLTVAERLVAQGMTTTAEVERVVRTQR